MVHLRAALVTLLTLTPTLLVAAPALADSTTSTLSLPTPLRDASLAWSGTYAYIFGGHDGSAATDLIRRFDPATGTTTTSGARMPVARGNTAAVWDPTVTTACPAGCAYVFGGDGLDDNFAAWSDDILRYDPASDTISLVGSLPRGRLAHAAVFDPRDRPEAGCDDGCAYLLGGNVATGCCVGGPSTEIVRYNPARSTVTILTVPLPDAVAAPSAVFDGSNVSVFAQGVSTDRVIRFDPVANTATSMAAVYDNDESVAVWSGTYAYLLGGQDAATTSAIVRYHPGSDGILTKAATLPTPRDSAVGFWDGSSAWVLGGVDATGVLDDIVRYTLEPGAPRTPAAVAGPAAGEIRLSWTAPAANTHDATITGYRVYRGESPGAGALVADLGPVLAWTDTARVAGVRYHYTVRAVDANGESPPSAEVSFRLPTPPSAPLDLTVTPTGRTEVTLNWTRPADDGGATPSYRVYYGNTTEDLRWYSAASGTGIRVSGLQAGKPYLFGVVSANSAGDGAWAYATGSSLALPLPPTDIVAVAGPGAGEVTVSFTAPTLEPDVPAIDAYRIYRCTSAAPASCTTYDATATTSGVAGGLARNTFYYFFVKSVNSVGESAWGGWAGAKTFNVPGAPTATAVALASDTSASFTWSAPTSNGGLPVTGYRVYRSVAFGPYTLVAQPTTTSYLDAGLSPGTRYGYSVRAVNDVGEGNAGTTVSLTTPGAPGVPVAVVANLTQALGEARVSWQAPVSNGGRPVLGYTVHRGEAPGAYDASFDAGDATSFLDAGLAPATRYHYAVSARNAVGEGARSADVSVLTWDDVAPGAPTGLVARSGPVYGGVSLNWTAPAPNGGLAPTSYVVYRALGAEPFAPVATVAGLAFADAGLVDGTAYRYQVAAANAVGEGAASAAATAVARAPILPAVAAGTALAQVGGKVYLFGGENLTGALDTILVYDPATNATSVVRAVLPTPRTGVAAVAVGDQVWLFGGRNGATAFSQILVFDPATLSVTPHATALPYSARSEIAATYADGDVWLYGGRTPSGTTVCSQVRFRPATGAIVSSSGTFACVYGATAIPVAGENVLAGGCWSGFASCGDFVAHFSRAGGGESRNDVLLDEHIHGGVVWDGTSVVVLGGWDVDTETASIEVLEGFTSSKRLDATLPQPRSRGSAWWNGTSLLWFGGTGCGGNGGYCPLAPLVVTVRPAAPQAIVATPTGDRAVLVQWLAPDEGTFTGLEAYELTRVDPDGTRTLLGTLAGTRTTFTDRDAPLGVVGYELVARAAGGHLSRASTTTVALTTPPVGT